VKTRPALRLSGTKIHRSASMNFSEGLMSVKVCTDNRPAYVNRGNRFFLERRFDRAITLWLLIFCHHAFWFRMNWANLSIPITLKVIDKTSQITPNLWRLSFAGAMTLRLRCLALTAVPHLLLWIDY
jgi:hypothetical protein